MTTPLQQLVSDYLAAGKDGALIGARFQWMWSYAQSLVRGASRPHMYVANAIMGFVLETWRDGHDAGDEDRR